MLEAATRLGQRALWARTLKLQDTTLEQVWDSIEDFAREEWRTPDELVSHLRGWLDRHDPEAEPGLGATSGRYLGYGHGGLVRRPLTGGWQAQGAPGYRTASALLGPRDFVLADPEAAVDAVLRRHLSASGPASRHDVAWWSGLGLRAVDAGLVRLAAELTGQDGDEVRARGSAGCRVDGIRDHDLRADHQSRVNGRRPDNHPSRTSSEPATVVRATAAGEGPLARTSVAG